MSNHQEDVSTTPIAEALGNGDVSGVVFDVDKTVTDRIRIGVNSKSEDYLDVYRCFPEEPEREKFLSIISGNSWLFLTYHILRSQGRDAVRGVYEHMRIYNRYQKKKNAHSWRKMHDSLFRLWTDSGKKTVSRELISHTVDSIPLIPEMNELGNILSELDQLNVPTVVISASFNEIVERVAGILSAYPSPNSELFYDEQDNLQNFTHVGGYEEAKITHFEVFQDLMSSGENALAIADGGSDSRLYRHPNILGVKFLDKPPSASDEYAVITVEDMAEVVKELRQGTALRRQRKAE